MATDKKKKKSALNPLALAVQQGARAAEEAKKQQTAKKAKTTAKSATNPIAAATKSAVKSAGKIKKEEKERNRQKSIIRTNREFVSKNLLKYDSEDIPERRASLGDFSGRRGVHHPDAVVPEGQTPAENPKMRTDLNPSRLAIARGMSGTTAKDLAELAKSVGIDADRKKAKHKKGENYQAAVKKQQELNKAKLSYHDKRLDAGGKRIVQQAKLDYDKAKAAGDIQGMAEAHEKAERQRAWAGYSGGATGAEYLSPKLSREDSNLLNKEGEKALKKAKLDYDKAQKAGDTEAMAAAAARGQEIRQTRGYLDSPGLQHLIGSDREAEYTTQDEKDLWAKQTAAAVKAGGTGIAGSLLSFRETANQAMQNYQKDRYGTRLQNLANNRSAIQARLDLVRRGEGNPEWGTERELEALLYQAEQAQRKLESGNMVDPNLPGQRLMEKSQEYTAEALQGKEGMDRLLTQAGISMLQNAPSMGLALIPGVGPAVGAGLMGAQAAGSKAYDLNTRGIDPQEAFTRGLISGGIEAVTERLPLGSLAKIVRGEGGKSVLKNIARQAGIEATEEGAAYVGNYIADKAAQDPTARFDLNELAENAAVGAISGLGFGGAGTAINAAVTARSRPRTGNPLLDTIRDAQGSQGRQDAQDETTTQSSDALSELRAREQAYADHADDLIRRWNNANPRERRALLEEQAQLRREEQEILSLRSRLNQQEQTQERQSPPIQEQEQAPQEQPIQEPPIQDPPTPDWRIQAMRSQDRQTQEPSPTQETQGQQDTTQTIAEQRQELAEMEQAYADLTEELSRRWNESNPQQRRALLEEQEILRQEEQAILSMRRRIQQQEQAEERQTEEGTEEPYSVGAAPRGFDPYTRAANEYGTIQPGENPARIIDVPRSTTGEDRVRRYARTALEAEITNPETIERLEQDIIDGGFSYNVRKDKASMDKAVQTIEDKGAMGALRQWMDVVEGRRTANKDDLVLAQLLYVNAERSGDTNLAAQLAAQIAAEGTVAGQNVQALRLLKQATPEGRIYYMRKIVGKINEDLAKGKRIDKLAEDSGVQLNEDLVRRYLEAENDAEQSDVLNEIYDDIVRQMPRTFGDALTAWRYFAMLGNPRTHIRNIVGNIVFGSVRNASNELSSALQRVAIRNPEARTRAIKSTRAARDFARQDYLEMKDALSGTKYDDDMSEIRRRQQERALGPFSFLSKANTAALSAEDNFFKKKEYIRSMASYVTAKGWDPSNLSRMQLQEARTHAMNDALEATFQEANAVASKIAEIERMNKVTKVAVGGAFPFKGVPINIAREGFRYSPAGLIKAITADAAKVRSGEMTAAQMIDNLSSGLTGTGIAVLGYFLSSMGMVNSGASDNDKERALDIAQGSQNYSINIGPYSYTIDWAAPAVLPFFMGAEFQNMLEEDEGDAEESTADKKFRKALDALQKMFEPMMNMTVLSGVSDAIGSASYGAGEKLTSFAGSLARGYAGQVIPTLAGQIARTIDPVRRSTYVDKDSGIPASVQRFLQTQQNKIPGLTKNSVPYLNVWGEESSIENPLLRALQNFVSPGYIAMRKEDSVASELKRLNSLGYDDILLSTVEKGKSIDLDKDGTKERLTRDQWETWQKSQGQTAKTLLGNLMASQSYQNMSNDEKAEAVSSVLDYAKAAGRLDAGGSEKGVASWILNSREYADKFGNGSPQGFFDVYNKKRSIDSADYDNEIKQGQFIEYVNSLDKPEEEKNYLLDAIKFYNMNPAKGTRYLRGSSAGLTVDEMQQANDVKHEGTYDFDGNGSYKKSETIALVNALGDTPERREQYWEYLRDSDEERTFAQYAGSSGKKKKSSGKKSSKNRPINILV